MRGVGVRGVRVCRGRRRERKRSSSVRGPCGVVNWGRGGPCERDVQRCNSASRSSYSASHASCVPGSIPATLIRKPPFRTEGPQRG